ncbi:hypothetical protein B0H14DRAFT_2591200 [Mycena olivaceomarginata]|nr:hypothetical protein B0H14DRAFT_2591200 [Mycena olivaceomarginata]
MKDASASFIKDQQKQAENYVKHCSAAQLQAYDLSSLVGDQALTASAQAAAFRMALEGFLSDEELYKKLLRKHSRKEPKDGKCEAILVASVPGYSRLVKDAEFIRDASPKVSSKTVSKIVEVPQSQATGFRRRLHDPFYACTTW